MYCFTCKEDFESMMTCIYRVWEAKKGRQNVRLEIEPVEQLHGGTVDSCGDHRIAMCAAVAATRCAGEVTILHGECVEKSYPRFYEDYRQLGGIANVIVLES